MIIFNRIWNRIANMDNVEKSGFISLAIKPISIILSLVYTPILLSYLGDEKYGLWATILSVITWINYFDVGIGNGLRNSLTKELTNAEYGHAKKLVSTAYVVLSGISLGILVILLLSAFFLDWNKIFSTELFVKPTLAITFVFICINFILSLVNTIFYALQMAEKVAIRNCIIQLINIAFIVLLSILKENDLVYTAIAFGTSTFFVNAISTYLVTKNRAYLRPTIRCFCKSTIPEICKSGMQFFIIQIMCLLMFTMDNIIISHYFGPTVVTPFSVANKVYNTGYSFLAAFLVPYWSGTTSAVERHDLEWIRQSIKKAIRVLMIFIVGSLIFTFFYDTIVALWLNKHLEYDYRIPIIMCVFYILYAVLAIECQFINGTGKLRTQLIMYIFLGVSNIPLSIYLGVSFNLGSYGVRLATTILVFIADIVLGLNLRNIIKASCSQNVGLTV